MIAARNFEKSRRLMKPIYAFCLVLIFAVQLIAGNASCVKFDEFSDLNCEDLQARLDAYSVQLGEAPTAQGYIVVSEGKYRNGRNPRRGESRARAARIKDYLVNYRGLKSERVMIVDGGHREDFTVELYLCPPGALIDTATRSENKNVKFSRGKIKRSEYKWSCL